MFFTGSYSNNVFPDPLSSEEEEKCITEMLNGSTEARNKLIEHNLRLVAHIVKKFDNKDTCTDDLISIGTIGLIKGIDTYKNNKKTKITTYAARCIQNEILMYFRANKDDGPDIIDELHVKDNIELLNKYLMLLNPREKEIIVKRYGLNNQKEKTQKEIAKELKISRSYVSRIEKRALTKILREFLKSNQDL